jgi:hypothetical protein
MKSESKFIRSVSFFNLACGLDIKDPEVEKIKKSENIRHDIPIALIGLFKELYFSRPQYYWKRDVASEVNQLLSTFIVQDNRKFLLGFEKSSIEFFESIRSFENITKSISEIRNVAFEESFKTQHFRNPIFGQICENFLMNLYRLLKNIINEYSDKDYSNLNTLGQVIPCLVKNGFSNSTSINLNLRNAVNHGNVFVSGSTINYRYGKSPKEYENISIKYWDYDNIIDESYDIACGVLLGILQVLVKNPTIISEHFETSEYSSFHWFRLIYKNAKVKVLYLDEAMFNEPQLNINIETSIEYHDNLVIALIEIAKGAFIQFPNYQRYLVGYSHNRSSPGFIRLTNEQLTKSDKAAELYQMAIDTGDILIMPIMDQGIHENAYKYHVFPKISSKYGEIIDIKDCSVGEFKRLKATLILHKRFKKRDIKNMVSNIIDEMKKLETPENPYDRTKFGKVESDMVFLNIFLNNPDRRKFNLLPKNTAFVCLAHYYKDNECPRLDHGGVMIQLWNVYIKEKLGKNIQLAWNPMYKSPLI